MYLVKSSPARKLFSTPIMPWDPPADPSCARCPKAIVERAGFTLPALRAWR